MRRFTATLGLPSRSLPKTVWAVLVRVVRCTGYLPAQHFDADDDIPNTGYLVGILQLFDFGSFLSRTEPYNRLRPSHTTYRTVRVTEVEAYGTDDGTEIAVYRPYNVRP